MLLQTFIPSLLKEYELKGSKLVDFLKKQKLKNDDFVKCDVTFIFLSFPFLVVSNNAVFCRKFLKILICFTVAKTIATIVNIISSDLF